MKLKELIGRFLDAKRLTVRERTLEWYHYNLDPLAMALGDRDVEQVTTEDLEGFLAGQYQGRSPRRRRHQSKIPDIFTESEIRAMLQAAGNRRDRAILLTLLDTGLRRAELLGLDVKDVDFGDGFLKVHGKGDKDRYVPIENETLSVVREYLMEGHPRHGPLWCNRFDKRLQAGGLRSMLLRIQEKAGLASAVHPHKFRHTFARYYLKYGDLESLREILGHADIRLTAQTYGTFLRGWIKQKHSRCSPVANGNWAQGELEL